MGLFGAIHPAGLVALGAHATALRPPPPPPPPRPAGGPGACAAAGCAAGAGAESWAKSNATDRQLPPSRSPPTSFQRVLIFMQPRHLVYAPNYTPRCN